MKYAFALSALAAAAVSAQDISVFPQCALPCIITAVGTTSCAATDFACVCKNMDAVKTAATPCVVDKCGVDKALNEVLPATEKFCAAVDTNPPAATTSDTPAPTTAATTAAPPAPTSTSAEEPAPSPTGGDDSGDDDSDGEEEPEETGAPSVPPSSFAPSQTSSEPTKPTSSLVPTAGAAALKAASGFGMLVLGAVAAL